MLYAKNIKIDYIFVLGKFWHVMHILVIITTVIQWSKIKRKNS